VVGVLNALIALLQWRSGGGREAPL
jgi:hypothetical protein